ncbi:GNAT family N-acetyltransferase [Hahella aquimaris]|uniref:GNAT family N-acetyltransferase n=1 Tax=Hahella sp. HNIBRBA332 TaxID=3015983 RepID=UPI00273CD16A|nr:GNAT family N-acetyltransferase [Hahella sp. HNIBRBA332]WLQ14968.1 GNAT family N-acetyltransferase [Hahella sp. HNIBRBA332]
MTAGEEIRFCSPRNPMAAALVEELSQALRYLTGDDGRSSFSEADVETPDSAFVVLLRGGAPVACGALRPLLNDCAEIKRMYSRSPGGGLVVLAALERRAGELGYREIRLSTRKINDRAIAFYRKHGYVITEPYGKYRETDLSVCFSKRLQPNS